MVHARAFTKHTECDDQCPAHEHTLEGKRKLEERKRKAGKLVAEDDKKGSGEDGEESTAFAVRKRGRKIILDRDDDDDDGGGDGSNPAPSASASQVGSTPAPSAGISQVGTPMDVDIDVPGPANTKFPSIQSNLTFNIAVVLDIGVRSNYRDIKDDSSWSKAELRSEEVDEMLKDEGLTGFIHRHEDDEDEEDETLPPENGHVVVWVLDRVSANWKMLAGHTSDTKTT